MKRSLCLLLVAFMVILSLTSSVFAGEKVKAGVLRLTSSAPMFIAVEKGFFAEQGLDVEMSFFKSATPITVAMAAGEVDVGATGVTAALYNAKAGGAGLTLVADKGRIWPDYKLVGLMASNDAWTNGIRSIKDLKGKRVGITQIGSTFHYMLGNMLTEQGLSLKDVKVSPLGGVKNMMDSVTSGKIETAFMVQPFCTSMEAKKQGKIMLWAGEHMTYQIAAIFISDKFKNDRKKAIAFMKGYINATRYFYDNCLVIKNGSLVKGSGFDEIMSIIAKYTGNSPKMIAQGLPYMDRNGKLLKDDIAKQIAWYKSNGFIKGNIEADQIVDTTLWQEALEALPE